MVAILWLLDTAHIVLCTIAVYAVLVLHFNDPSILVTTTWCVIVQTDFNGLIGFIAECFYARRVWIVSGNAFLTAIILILSVVHFGLGIVFTVGSFETARADFGQLVWVTSAGLGSAAAADMLIGTSLCWYLSKNRTGFQRTDNLITTLMKYSLTTGFLTGIIACLVVLTFGLMPNNFVYVAFFWLLGKCYVNSVLAALNSRESLRERAQPRDGSFLRMSGVVIPSGITSPIATRTRRMPSLSVNVQTAIVTKSDYPAPPSPSTANSIMSPRCS
ncbi:hypothetical protein C8R46DRAFT_1079410 [Mycena filopes]|nr:hypothetical protein C8R46DRAFT_1079410 [Mycena filopes]